MIATVLARTLSDSEQVARELAADLQPGQVVFLCGGLGVGKTTLAQMMLRELGCDEAVTSPTFALVNSYRVARFSVHHFDLYRMQHSEELELIGIRDYFNENDVCLVEWPERAAGILPPADLRVDIDSVAGSQAREFRIERR